ncbi:DUF6358 family protein [Mucilaginibacter sp. E4BP6]|jgi:hypothetical protein|uniref:DUF6358 family protein n=1 Tax=Mucilaginibacter sp. E4BP6 TaxID=2723089 RepID=UPI0015CC0ABD|nr:DUF6358 family protein [Mucilaginibacter sp. E4BP6]NYE68317.1 hypothetical protein [Mucilaginibacter sp. E4BP6]
MFKKAMLNFMYNIGIFGSLAVGYMAFDRKSFYLVFPAIFALVFFVMQKIKLMKQIKSMPRPNPDIKTKP